VVLIGCGFYLFAFRRRITRRMAGVRGSIFRSGSGEED
jgi:hypothetical protein